MTWNHNADNRRGVPYRDDKSRERCGKQTAGSQGREAYRGRDAQRDASRQKAQAALADRGMDPAKGRETLRDDPQTRQRAQAAAKSADRDKARAAAAGKDRNQVRDQGRTKDRSRPDQPRQNSNRDHAFQDASNPGRTRQTIAAAIGAFEDQGVPIPLQDRSAGVVQGNCNGIDVNANVLTQADGSVRVEFNTSGATATDPARIDRITQAYNRRMGR